MKDLIIGFLAGLLVMYLFLEVVFKKEPDIAVVNQNEIIAQQLENNSDSLINIIDSIKAELKKQKHKVIVVQALIDTIKAINDITDAYYKYRPDKTNDSVITPIDSLSLKITNDEGKYIIKTFIDYDYIKNIEIKELDEIIEDQYGIIENDKKIKKLNANTIKELKDIITELTPSWISQALDYAIPVVAFVLGILVAK